MNRLILILDTTPNPATTAAFTQLCRQLDAAGNTPTFALGLVPDVTLALTSRWPHLIYNAFEFLSLTEPAHWQLIAFDEVHTVIAGQAFWQGEVAGEAP
ncbi:MAG: hypothetical protein WAX89_02010 [Alphaproteobacteria bacterium]